MTQLPIEIMRNQADAACVAAHLLACDNLFEPPLSTRVDLVAYATKIVLSAERLEAWSGGQLAGLVAAYANDPERRAAFVTSVSVLPAWQGCGLASTLLAACVEYIRGLGFACIELEVDMQNLAASKLYEKHGFVLRSIHCRTQTLQLAC